MKGNPDGTISLFFKPDMEGISSVIEMSVENEEESSADTETILVQDVHLFAGRQQNPYAEITEYIGELCNLHAPIKMENSVFWRTRTLIPAAWVKDILDGGITKRYGLSSWGGAFILDGHVVMWNGVIVSLELIVYTEDKAKLLDSLPKEFSAQNGFIVSVSDDHGISRISVTDNFVLNFSSLWGA